MAMRIQNSVILAKIETTEGVDAVPVVGTDAIVVDAATIAPAPDIVESEELTGSIDEGIPIVGGMTIQFTGNMPLKGSGSASTPPEISPLLRACGWELETNTALGSATATAGSTTSATVDLTVDTDYPAADGDLVGEPITFSGGSLGSPFTSIVSSYEVTGTNAVIEIVDTAPATLNGSTLAHLANIKYVPGQTIPTVTIYFYLDGRLYKLVGGRGDSANLTLEHRRKGQVAFSIKCLLFEATDVALPAQSTIAYQTTRPKLWLGRMGGVFSINRNEVGVNTFTVNVNNTNPNPPNPNAQEGFDPAVITRRRIEGAVNPNMALFATGDYFADMRAGTPAMLHGRFGTAVGERISVLVSRAQYQNVTPGNTEGLAIEDIPYRAMRDARKISALTFY